jgi:hypothetical protein
VQHIGKLLVLWRQKPPGETGAGGKKRTAGKRPSKRSMQGHARKP